MPFVDLHSHILPGFDDGAADDAEFLAMAEAAVRGGTTLMVATPHYDPENPGLDPGGIPAAVEEHADMLRSRGIPLGLSPGVEVRINAALFSLAREGSPLNGLGLGESGRYLLVDLPLFDLPMATSEILFQIQLCGAVPILAHPERNRYLVEHPAVLRDLVDRGVELQVNSGSLEQVYGKRAQRMARSLLSEGLVRVVASDAHKPRNRGPDLSGAARAIARLAGEGAARILLEENPLRVLDGQSLLDAGGGPRRGRGRRRGLGS